jgi:site-specific DNA recombinase
MTGDLPRIHYASRSKEEEAGKDSTGDQLASLSEKFGPPAAEYADHASGYTKDRGDALQRAMEHAARLADEHGRAELCVFKSERLARGSGRKDEARSVMEVYVEMRRAGVDLRSVEDDAFLTNPMLVGVADEMAHKYSRDLSAHVRRGIRNRDPAKGPWGQPAYGFRKREDRHWDQDPHEAPIARRIFDLYLETSSYNGVVAALTLEGVRPRRGSMWTTALIRKVITGRHVLGYHRRGGEWVSGKHEPIVDEATWEHAQRIAGNSRKWAPKGGGRLPSRHVFMRGMLTCGICGEAMLPRTERRRETYECRKHKVAGNAACPMPVLGRAQVEVPALQMFEQWALDVDGTRERLARQLSGRGDAAREQARRAAHEEAAASAALDRADREFAKGTIAAEDYARLTEKFRGELAASEAERQRLEARAEEVAATLGGLDAEHEGLRRLAELRSAIAGHVSAAGDDVQALRAAMAAVFSKVYVVPEALYAEQVEHDKMPGAWAPGLAAEAGGDLLVVPSVHLDMVADPLEAGETDAFLRRVAVAFGPLQASADNQHLTLVS